jgi:hypothetical protein
MEESTSSTWLIDAGIYLSYVLLAVALIAAIVLPLIKAVGDPKGLITSVIGVVVLLVVFGICYAVSSGDVPPRFSDADKGAMLYMTPSQYKLVGGSIVMCYVLLIGTILAVVYSQITESLK